MLRVDNGAHVHPVIPPRVDVVIAPLPVIPPRVHPVIGHPVQPPMPVPQPAPPVPQYKSPPQQQPVGTQMGNQMVQGQGVGTSSSSQGDYSTPSQQPADLASPPPLGPTQQQPVGTQMDTQMVQGQLASPPPGLPLQSAPPQQQCLCSKTLVWLVQSMVDMQQGLRAQQRRIRELETEVGNPWILANQPMESTELSHSDPTSNTIVLRDPYVPPRRVVKSLPAGFKMLN